MDVRLLSSYDKRKIVKLSRRAWYRDDPVERQLVADQPIIDALNAVVEQHARWGFWKCFYLLRILATL